jgi:hypothetical protein
MPLETAVVTDRESVRRWLQTAQRIISETGQSNSTRQIRLVFELPEAASVAEVRDWLSGKA